MKIREFIDRTGLTLTELAYRCGLSFHQINYIISGGVPKLKTAIIISKYTKHPKYRLADGCIEPEDLLPDEDLEDINKKYEKEFCE